MVFEPFWLGDKRRAALSEDDAAAFEHDGVVRQFEDLARMLCAYPLRVTGVRGYDQAQVTQGGIDPADFDPATMACKKHPGLYACGEILNVDGDCGGYNLQFAFATGLLAARDAAK